MTSIILRVQSFEIKDVLLLPFKKSIQCLEKSPRLYSAVKTVVACVFQLLNKRSKFSWKFILLGLIFAVSFLLETPPNSQQFHLVLIFFFQLSLLVHKQFTNITSFFSLERICFEKRHIKDVLFLGCLTQPFFV